VKILATEFRSNGFDFNQITRIEDVAWYEKKSGSHVSYEVVIVQRHDEYVIAGNTIQAGESMPGTSQWGQKGWTCRTWKEAESKFDATLDAERARLAARAAA
jgi:hypothetical protein